MNSTVKWTKHVTEYGRYWTTTGVRATAEVIRVAGDRRTGPGGYAANVYKRDVLIEWEVLETLAEAKEFCVAEMRRLDQTNNNQEDK